MKSDFWRFAYERQRIWHRRFVQLQLKPWTEDPILQRYRFCNVHRELDRGTIVIINDLQGRHDLESAVFNVLLYRLFNNTRTWVELGWLTRDLALAKVDELAARHSNGEKVFGAAWALTGGGPRPDGTRKSIGERASEAVRAWRVHEIIAGKSSMSSLYKAVTSQAAMGSIIGWQATLDLSYVFGLSDDVWVPGVKIKRQSPGAIGHGPAFSLGLIDSTRNFQDGVQHLRDEQDRDLSALGLDWGSVAWQTKPRLTLADLEHTLCEFTKYIGVKAKRRSLRLLER